MHSPNLKHMWEAFFRIGPCSQATFDLGLHVETLRKEVVPIVKGLQRAGVAEWFSLMIHDDVTFQVGSPPRQDALWHLRLSLADSAVPEELERMLTARFEAVRQIDLKSVMKIGGIDAQLFKSGSIADGWMILGKQTELLLATIDLYRDDADAALIAQDLRTFGHLFENPIYPEFKQQRQLVSVAPQFLVLDLQAACTFYEEKLGFRVAFIYEDFYAGVERDGVMIHLKLADAPDPSREVKRRDEHLDAYITVDDVTALFEEFQNRGVTFAQPLAATPWGTREFVVWDNSGFILYFAQSGLTNGNYCYLL